jgi:hypothetical protein
MTCTSTSNIFKYNRDEGIETAVLLEMDLDHACGGPTQKADSKRHEGRSSIKYTASNVDASLVKVNT